MRTSTKLATYGAGLVVVLVGSFGVGRTWDPTTNDQGRPTPSTTEIQPTDAHGQQGSP